MGGLPLHPYEPPAHVKWGHHTLANSGGIWQLTLHGMDHASFSLGYYKKTEGPSGSMMMEWEEGVDTDMESTCMELEGHEKDKVIELLESRIMDLENKLKGIKGKPDLSGDKKGTSRKRKRYFENTGTRKSLRLAMKTT